MKRFTMAAAMWLYAGLACGQSVTLPAEVRGGVGTLIVVSPDKVEGVPVWRIDPGLSEIRLDLLLPPELAAKLKGKVFQANKAGRYKVEAWVVAAPGQPLDRPALLAVLNDKSLSADAKVDRALGLVNGISLCTVVVGDPPPPEPPAPPAPTDALSKAVQAAYAAEADPQKAALVKYLAALHRAVAGAVTGNASLKTCADALNLLKAAVAAHPTLSAGGLAGLKAVTAQELNKLALRATDPLTQANRAAIADVLARTATAMEALR